MVIPSLDLRHELTSNVKSSKEHIFHYIKAIDTAKPNIRVFVETSFTDSLAASMYWNYCREQFL